MNDDQTGGRAGMRPALFLDRDGVINRDIDYCHRIEDFVWMDGIFDLARLAAARGHPIVVVTNQSGIGRGYYSEDDFHRLTAHMTARFAAEGAPLTAVYFSPHHPEATVARYRADHPWRKPKPGMLLAAADDHGLDLARSVLVGDRLSDIAAAAAAGLRAACLVSAAPAPPDLPAFASTVPDVFAAAAWYAGVVGTVAHEIALDEARHWLTRVALPFWIANGVDWARGGYHEQLDQHGRPNGDSKRLRVLTRQIYVFARGTALGVDGARAAMEHGLTFLLGPAKHPDGGFANRFSLDGAVIDDTRDLYDLAFVLLALGHAHAVTGRAALRAEAGQLLAFIDQRFRDGTRGLIEALPPRLPRRQNPHMHLFEALLVWVEQDPAGPFRPLMDELLTLLDVFVDREHAVLMETFDAALVPLVPPSESAVEPGHHFEWVWLLSEAERLTGRAMPLKHILYETAHRIGFDRRHGMLFGDIAPDGRVRNASTRVWPHTEWLRAECVMAGGDQGERIGRAWSVLARFLDVPVPGLWHERFDGEAGAFIDGPVPATTLYHLTGAVEALLRQGGSGR